MSASLADITDTARYPLSDPGGEATIVRQIREELETSGCSVLRGFVRPAACDALRRECATIAPRAYYDVETVNVYNTAPDFTLPEHHPARTTVERGNAFVPRDTIPDEDIIHRLYANAQFQRFIARCFTLPRLYELADPLAGLCLNVVTPGHAHPWHFDTNEFTVSMLTQAPAAGGTFEYCPHIRSAQQENLGDVSAVLAGRGDHLVHRLELRPGDLQLFQGRYSLHRVSPVAGDTERHSAIFAYSERPGVIGTLARTQQLFGRVTPDHLAAAGAPVRVDQLMD